MKKYILIFILMHLNLGVWALDTNRVQKRPQAQQYQLGTVRRFADLENHWQFIPTDTMPTNPISQLRQPTAEALRYIRQARATLKKIKDSKLYTALFNPTEQIKLPIGIHKTVGNQEYTIGIDSIVVTPNYTYLVAYLMVENPSDSSKLYFIGKQIKISKKGGLINAKLELAADYGLSVAGGKALVIFKANTSYVSFDCSGFQGMSVDASVVFSRDWLVVEKNDGTIDPEQRVVGDFKASINNWSDLLASINFRQPFQLRELPGYGFTVKQAVFDFSDLNSPIGMRMPPNYLDGGEENLNLWKGFYLREAEIRLPANFKNRNSGLRKIINIQDLIIDYNGVSGKLKALNLFTLEEGDMDKWKYSLDSLGFEVVKNQLISAGFQGRVVLPIAKQDETLTYKAIIKPRDNNYEFVVSTQSNLSFPVFKAAQVTLHPSSFLEVKSEQGKFLPRACLTGAMSIKGSMGNTPDESTPEKRKIDFPSLQFTELEVLSKSPYIRVKAFAFAGGGSLKMTGFPVSISNIAMKNYSDGTAIEFNLLVNLSKAEQSGFSAKAGLAIVGQMQENTNILAFKYKRIDVKDVLIDIKQGTFSLKGQLIFFRDNPTYGNGFQGLVNMEIKPKLEVAATALFGTTLDETRYWYADASVLFQTGISFVTPLVIKGFSGAAYYQMKQVAQANPATSASQIGITQTGLRYEPDSKTGLGIRAGIKFATQSSEQAFNGDATLELSFNRGGGLQRIFFNGNGYFATNPQIAVLDKMKEVSAKIANKASDLDRFTGNLNVGGALYDPNQLTNINQQIFGSPTSQGEKSQISASIHIEYNIDQKTLDGNFKVFVNAAGGLLKGVGNQGLAGQALLHFGPGKWFVHIGTPQQRVGLELASIARTTSYLMIGHDLPASPPPPAAVASILGQRDLDYMRDLNALGTGKGFAFGADLSINTGDLKFLMFYAKFLAGAGFDIMVKNYGPDVRCEGSNEPIGINGWYANGQVYAYIQGEIGMDVNVKFYKGKFKILEIAAAVLLQAKLPKPTWMKGQVGGNFAILGGLVKGNCKFEMTLGKECKIIGTPQSPLADFQMIAELSPKNNETDVDVFTNPQAVFNLEINKNFSIQDLEGRNRVFRAKIDKLLFKEVNGSTLVYTTTWNSDQTVLALSTKEVLPGEKEILFEVEVSFEEQVNGSWRVVVENGTKITEKRSVRFRTGKAPDYIPENNVAYSYPIKNQLHYLKDETPQGYIKLIRGQAYLFAPSTEWERKVKMSPIDNPNAARYAPLGYDANKLEVFFERPEGLLLNKIYKLEIVNVPLQDNAAIDSNVDSTFKSAGEGSEVSIREKNIENSLTQLQEKAIYTMHLKTSRYPTFIAKMNALNPNSTGWAWPIATGIHEIGITYQAQEFFDKFELHPVRDTIAPLISYQASPNALWLSQWISPLNYQNYPNEGISLSWRPAGVLGVPPLKEVYFNIQHSFNQLTEANLQTNNFVENNSYGSLRYLLAPTTYHDYLDLRGKAANHPNRHNNPWMQYILNNDWVSVQPGAYPVKASYRLPGTGRVTSEWNVMIQRP